MNIARYLGIFKKKSTNYEAVGFPSYYVYAVAGIFDATAQKQCDDHDNNILNYATQVLRNLLALDVGRNRTCMSLSSESMGRYQ